MTLLANMRADATIAPFPQVAVVAEYLKSLRKTVSLEPRIKSVRVPAYLASMCRSIVVDVVNAQKGFRRFATTGAAIASVFSINQVLNFAKISFTNFFPFFEVLGVVFVLVVVAESRLPVLFWVTPLCFFTYSF